MIEIMIHRQTFYVLSNIFRNDFNCTFYFFPITFKKTHLDLQTEWKKAIIFIENFKKELSKHFLVIGKIILIEPHKNTTLISKKNKNRNSARNNKDKTLLLVEIFAKLFKQLKLAVKMNKIYSRVEKTFYSKVFEMQSIIDWTLQRLNAKKVFFKLIARFSFFPWMCLQQWIFKQGKISKILPRIKLFPKLNFHLYFIKFKAKVYDFTLGKTVSLEEASPQTSTFCYVYSNFNKLLQTYTLLGFWWIILFNIK